MSASNLPSQKDAIVRAIELYGETRPFAVSDIGSQSAWLKAGSHHPRNLYVSGPMGLSPSVALGLAAVRPDDQVLAIVGDGSLAMNLSSLATIQGAKLSNLSVMVLDNGVYEYTASVPVPTRDLDWLALGAAMFGQGSAYRLEDLTPEKWAAVKRPAFIHARCAQSTEPAPGLGLTPIQIREQFLAVTKV